MFSLRNVREEKEEFSPVGTRDLFLICLPPKSCHHFLPSKLNFNFSVYRCHHLVLVVRVCAVLTTSGFIHPPVQWQVWPSKIKCFCLVQPATRGRSRCFAVISHVVHLYIESLCFCHQKTILIPNVDTIDTV